MLTVATGFTEKLWEIRLTIGDVASGIFTFCLPGPVRKYCKMCGIASYFQNSSLYTVMNTSALSSG